MTSDPDSYLTTGAYPAEWNTWTRHVAIIGLLIALVMAIVVLKFALAIPLTLNPVGIVMLVVASVEVKALPDAAMIIVMILIVMAVDLVVLYASDRVAKYLSHATVELLERVLGILPGALAVELILIGPSQAGVINLVPH